MKNLEDVNVVEELLEMITVWVVAFFILGMWSASCGIQLKMTDYIWYVTPLAVVTPFLLKQACWLLKNGVKILKSLRKNRILGYILEI